MSQDYNDIRTARFYQSNQQRRLMFVVQLLMILAGLQLLLCGYLYLSWPDRRYFASNSAFAGSIIELRPLTGPNQSSTALLAPDLPPETSIKSIDPALPQQQTVLSKPLPDIRYAMLHSRTVVR